ncbi:MAG TPA: hypothetical protein PLG04_00110 [Anaerolineaceae bacterium]|nr:hypothetical protein [Anaerolineaceae bacterium]
MAMDKKMSQVVGAVAGGAAVRALDRYAFAKIANPTKQYMPMMIGLGVGLLGTYGANMLPYQLKGPIAGMAEGALGIAGAEVLDFATKQGAFAANYKVGNYNFGYSPSYRYYAPAPIASSAGNTALEI